MPRAMIPYQKINHEAGKRRAQPTVKVINKPASNGNQYMKPIPRVQARPRLERVMPTTQKNAVEKQLEMQVRENYQQIA